MNGLEWRALLEQLSPLAPVGVILLAALVVVFLGLVPLSADSGLLGGPLSADSGTKRHLLCGVAIAGVVLGLVTLALNYASLAALHRAPPPWFGGAAGDSAPLILRGAFCVDGFGMAVAFVALWAGLLALLSMPREPETSPPATGEYHGLVLLAVAGMMLLGFAHDFLTLLISLEVMSVATYVLAGSRREDAKSGEAALKYLILGGFSTAFLLLGVAFFFGATGRITLEPLGIAASDPRFYLALAGLGLLLAGVFFKVGAVPFHFWIPDVYEGAPTPVTILMATGVKAAAFAVAGRLAFETFGEAAGVARWAPLVTGAAVCTMVLGNLVALHQESVKRMLAYSAVAHTGYLLLGFLVTPPVTPGVGAAHLGSVAFYLLAYAPMTAGAFGVVALTRADGRPLERFEDYRGLSRERPGLALCMALFMLSLAGLPPLAGFFAKFLVFRGAIEEGFVLPAVLGILASVASLYYYLRVVLAMYMTPEPEGRAALAPCRPGWTARLMIYGAGAATVLLGLFPPDLVGLGGAGVLARPPTGEDARGSPPQETPLRGAARDKERTDPMDFGKRMEPRGRRVLHGAGQSPDEFRKYCDVMGTTQPVLYMSYCGLKRDVPKFFANLQAELAKYPTFLIPQIGLGMTSDGKPELHYEQDVAAGQHDVALQTFCAGLKQLARPVYLRIGYEFSGHWNGYVAETYKAAWTRILTALRDHHLDEVATVWCYSPDSSNKDYASFYPGDDQVDWWGIDVFAPEHFDAADTVAFMRDARAHGFPVMIGESTPRRVGVLNGAASWDGWFARYFRFIRENPHLKAFCYISWEWSGYPQWHDWGDGRIHANAEVLERYRRELADPSYVHARPETELRRELGLP